MSPAGENPRLAGRWGPGNGLRYSAGRQGRGQVPEKNDQDLVRAFREGDDEALELLLQRFRGLLADRIRRRLPQGLRRRVSVDDVLQDVHLAAHESRERFSAQDERALRSWLLAIADHKSLQHVRHHGDAAKRSVHREVTQGSRLPTTAYPKRQDTPSQVAIAAETLRLARRARARLPSDHAEVLRLAREEGRPLREVAVLMGRSYEATKKLYGRALCAFKELFDAMRDEADD